MDFFLPQNVSMIIDKLEYNGFEAYIVGGCVRDSILGKKPMTMTSQLLHLRRK